MSSCDPAGPRVSFRRVVLLLLLGASACMALTDPGRWVADKFLPRDQRIGAPIWLESAPHQLRLDHELRQAFGDPGVHASLLRFLTSDLSDEAVIARLARLDGWSTCVLLEMGSTPPEVEAAGIADREACVAIANAAGRSWWRVGPRVDESDLGWRTWILLLLDDQGRRAASVDLTTVRQGWALTDPQQGILQKREGAPGDGGLPGERVFRLCETGEVVAG
jgi:hypothetical protein